MAKASKMVAKVNHMREIREHVGAAALKEKAEREAKTEREANQK